MGVKYVSSSSSSSSSSTTTTAAAAAAAAVPQPLVNLGFPACISWSTMINPYLVQTGYN